MKICTKNAAVRRLFAEIYQELTLCTVEQSKSFIMGGSVYDGEAAPGVK